jgi:hypothetical protein
MSERRYVKSLFSNCFLVILSQHPPHVASPSSSLSDLRVHGQPISLNQCQFTRVSPEKKEPRFKLKFAAFLSPYAFRFFGTLTLLTSLSNKVYHLLLLHFPAIYDARAGPSACTHAPSGLLLSLITDWKSLSVVSALLLSSVDFLQ